MECENTLKIEELKEKIILLRNFHKVKDKKIKLFKEQIERDNILINKQKQEIKRLNKEIEKLRYGDKYD